MTPQQQQAKELIEAYLNLFRKTDSCFVDNCKNSLLCQHSWYNCETWLEYAKQCAVICVQRIILANPHSNPFNTDVHSTMDYWLQVQEEIKKFKA